MHEGAFFGGCHLWQVFRYVEFCEDDDHLHAKYEVELPAGSRMSWSVTVKPYHKSSTHGSIAVNVMEFELSPAMALVFPLIQGQMDADVRRLRVSLGAYVATREEAPYEELPDATGVMSVLAQALMPDPSSGPELLEFDSWLQNSTLSSRRQSHHYPSREQLVDAGEQVLPSGRPGDHAPLFGID